MKVLHVINSLGTGGAEKLLIDSLPSFSERLDVVDLLLIDGRETPFLSELTKGFKGKVFSLTNSGSIYNPLFIKHLLPYIKKYDLCHVHLFPSLYYVALCKSFYQLNTRLCFTEHNTNNRRLSNPIFRTIDKFVYSQFENIICITEQVKNVLCSKMKLDPQKCFVINNGVKLNQFTDSISYKKEIFDFRDSDIVLLQVSRFFEQKDQKTLIEALRYLPANVKLLLVGSGPLMHDCKQLSIQLNVQERVRFLGVRMDVPSIVKTSDIVIQSSNWEGFGIAAVEGMASGKPVIASDVPGLREVVKDAGLLFTKGNAQDLASKVKQLLNNTAYYEEVSKSCLKRSIQYSIENLVDSTIDLYKRTLDDAS